MPDERKTRTITLEVDEKVCELLQVLAKGWAMGGSGTVEDVVEKLIDHAQQGVYRPGAWERGWLHYAFSDDWEAHLHPGDPYGRPNCEHIFQRPPTEEEAKKAAEEEAYQAAYDRGEICERCDSPKKSDEKICAECERDAAYERGEICELCDEPKKADERICSTCAPTATDEIWYRVCPHCEHHNAYRPFGMKGEQIVKAAEPVACVKCNGNLRPGEALAAVQDGEAEGRE